MKRSFQITINEMLAVSLMILSGLFFSIYYGAQTYQLRDVVMDMTNDQVHAKSVILMLQDDLDFYRDLSVAEVNSMGYYTKDCSIEMYGETVTFSDENGLLDFEVSRGNDGKWYINTWWDAYEYSFGDIVPFYHGSVEAHLGVLPVSQSLKDVLLNAFRGYVYPGTAYEPVYNMPVYETFD